ncbi:MAG: hypothetical protein ABSB69_02570 [Solirubrobacteraceae bacterium]
MSQGTPPSKVPANTHYFSKIQEAVNASTEGDFVLIEPGTYDEEVTVTSAQSGIYIRGMNRNTVIIDGQGKVGNGIDIIRANNVWVENLTVRNFEFGEGCSVEECGNDIWWDGRGGGKPIGAHGWYGSYLTAYDTSYKGGYGIFANSETEGEFNHIYASGFADSGFYIGACQECDGIVRNAVMEDNALGYSGSNAGGRLIIEKSTFAHNSVGLATNSENPGDPPPPQDGECGRPETPSTSTPTITSTNIPRCTILRRDSFVDNSNLTVPTNGSTEVAPWGVGVELPGDYADLVKNNTISGNPNVGVLGFEYPNPFPLPPFCENPEGCGTIDFQFAGNRISGNTFANNGSNGGAFAGDVAMLSGSGEWLDENFGFTYPPAASVDNCLTGNHFSDATYPANIERNWNCRRASTPNPGGGAAGVFYLIGLIEEAAVIKAEHPPVPQPAPPAQTTMPNPCMGVPRDPLCR